MTSPQQDSRYSSSEKARHYHETIVSAHPFRRLSQFLELGAVSRALREVSGISVLDAPCGTGRIDPVLRQRFSHITGLDASESMLAVYRQGLPGREAVLASIFDLPFSENHFDWVVCHRFFHHLKHDSDRIRLLESLCQVARQGVIFYAWINNPLRRRTSSRRQSLPLDHVRSLIKEAGLHFESCHYSCWPFQVKAILVCTKQG